jgi:hypothetical protein
VRFAPVLLFCALLLAACGDAFDPFVESDQTFALYGFLDARRDTQFVRVEAITDRAEPGSAVEALVTSTDLATGAATSWRDTLLRRDDGALGSAFFAVFRPEPGRMYRIEAARPDAPGAASAAVVAIPAEPPLWTAAPETVGDDVVQRLTLPGGLVPENVRIVYRVRRVGADGDPIGFSFNRAAQPALGGGAFDVLVPLTRDARAIRTTLGIDPEDPGGDRLALLDLELVYEIVDTERAEVTGGVGNVGAAAGFAAGWTLAPEFVRAIGFEDAQAASEPLPARRRGRLQRQM